MDAAEHTDSCWLRGALPQKAVLGIEPPLEEQSVEHNLKQKRCATVVKFAQMVRVERHT